MFTLFLEIIILVISMTSKVQIGIKKHQKLDVILNDILIEKYILIESLEYSFIWKPEKLFYHAYVRFYQMHFIKCILSKQESLYYLLVDQPISCHVKAK